MRTSRKQVEKILDVISSQEKHYKLIAHQELGNRKNYYYTYSIVTELPKYTDLTMVNGEMQIVEKDYITGYTYNETLLHTSSLKKAYDFAYKLFEGR